ncbi:MAG TPA: hypothetical protein ENK18_17570 [Deltaproteobacteria bacterium]|nr:hypothetical protein [Deltaproteobacteria bacterium]
MCLPMRIAFAITRAASVDSTWTTIHLAQAALARGDAVRFIEPWDYEIDTRGRLIARAHAFDRPSDAEHIAGALVHRSALRRYVDLERIELLLLRAAPLNPGLLSFAEIAKERGVPVVNDPAGLLRVSHKGWLASLQGVRLPTTLVTRSRASCHVFAQGQPDGIIVKPARGSGGRDVSRVLRADAVGLDAAFDRARAGGDGYVVVQQYLPEAEWGEKRLIWLDGAVIGGYLRRRAPGEFRHNLKRGGQAEHTEITSEDTALAAEISPHLVRAGVRLAGLDVIGSYLIEVNALNPGGAFHADRLSGSRLGEEILDRLTHRPEEQRTSWALPAP